MAIRSPYPGRTFLRPKGRAPRALTASLRPGPNGALTYQFRAERNAALVCSFSRSPGWRQLVAIQPVATSRRHPDSKPTLGWNGSAPLGLTSYRVPTGSPRPTRGSVRFSCSSLLVCLLLLLAAPTARAQTTAPENQIKAACLAKFSQYLEWPATAFTNADQPILIGILGADPFGPEFDERLRAFKTTGRPVQARRLRRVEDAPGCHLVYISASENGNLKTLLAALRGQPIFTAGDHEDFLNLGGALRFWRHGDQIAFQISPDALRAAQIKAHPRLLLLSREPPKLR